MYKFLGFLHVNQNNYRNFTLLLMVQTILIAPRLPVTGRKGGILFKCYPSGFATHIHYKQTIFPTPSARSPKCLTQEIFAAHRLQKGASCCEFATHFVTIKAFYVIPTTPRL